MAAKVTLTHLEKMAFDVEVNGFHLTLDADSEFGGQDKGPRPKPLLLAALSGCSAMDVVSLLDKMRWKDYGFDIDVEADMTTGYPQTYNTIRMIYKLTGENLNLDQLVKAVELSRDKYCGVMAMLAKAARINISIQINGKEVWHD